MVLKGGGELKMDESLDEALIIRVFEMAVKCLLSGTKYKILTSKY